MKKYLILLIILGLTIFSSCERLFFEKEIDKNPVTTFDYLWNEVNTKYAFLEYKKINWDSIYNVYRPHVSNDINDDSLFNVMARMLNELRDGHVNLKSAFNISRYDSFYIGRDNIDFQLIREKYLGDDYLITGPFKHNYIHNKKIGYILYNSFSSSMIKDFEINYILNKYKNTKGLIIDIRQNGGGYISNVFKLLSIFTDKEKKIYEPRIKSGPGKNDFSLLEEVKVEPRKGDKYLKKVAILTDRGSYSASSFFSLGAKAFDNFFVVGDTTGGGLGLPNGGQLPNGWTYRFSITQTIAIDGQNYENGVPPDFTIILNKDSVSNKVDNVIEFAVRKILE